MKYWTYTWHPPFQIACRLPERFTFSFECSVDTSGVRRFVPQTGLNKFLPWASLVGHSVLDDRGDLKEELPFSYDEFRLLDRYIRHSREHIGATPNLSLVVPTTAAGRLGHDDEDKDILPADIGLYERGEGEEGKRWTLARFLKEGRDAASEAGIEAPKKEDIFVHAVFRAAQRAPLTVTKQKEIVGLFRMALLSSGPSAEKTEKRTLEFVADQLKIALREHLDDSSEEYSEWLADRKSNLIHRIAKRRDCPTDRVGVRQAIVELGAQLLWLQGDCVDAFMRTFCAALPEPLAGYEEKFFESIYLKQPRFGNLPLVLLWDRFDFCKLAIPAIWLNPDDDAEVKVLYRMLAWFAEMLEKKRDADRRRKARRDSKGKTSRHKQLPKDIKSPKKNAHEKSSAIHATMKADLQQRIEMRLKIDLELEEWDVRYVSEDEDSVTVRVLCPSLGIG